MLEIISLIVCNKPSDVVACLYDIIILMRSFCMPTYIELSVTIADLLQIHRMIIHHKVEHFYPFWW